MQKMVVKKVGTSKNNIAQNTKNAYNIAIAFSAVAICM